MSNAYTISTARYAKGKMLIQANDGLGGFKGRAAYLAEAVGGRYVNRSKGYVVSPTQVEKFEKLYRAGYTGHIMGKGVEAENGMGERDIVLTVASALKLIDAANR